MEFLFILNLKKRERFYSLALDETSFSQTLHEHTNQVDGDNVTEGRNDLVDHVGRGEVFYILARDPTALGLVVVNLVVNRIDRLFRHDVQFMKHVE